MVLESFGTVSYSHSIATVAVLEPFRHNTRTWRTPSQTAAARRYVGRA